MSLARELKILRKRGAVLPQGFADMVVNHRRGHVGARGQQVRVVKNDGFGGRERGHDLCRVELDGRRFLRRVRVEADAEMR